MAGVRLPAVAGLFYPADPPTLRSQVRQLLASAARTGTRESRKPPQAGDPGKAREPLQTGELPRALIVPHAGYNYSGPVAASGYIRLAPVRDRIRRVVLVGPAHHVGFRGLAGSSASAFATPLGEVEVERLPADAERLGISANDRAHAPEHSLEVQLPFLLEELGTFTIVPLLTGQVTADVVSRALLSLWGPETLVVVSSDLSHYLPWAEARQRDAATSAAIERLEPALVAPADACGHSAVQGVLLAARVLDLRARAVDLRNSGDVSGRRGEVVGYGAFVFTPAGPVPGRPGTIEEVQT